MNTTATETKIIRSNTKNSKLKSLRRKHLLDAAIKLFTSRGFDNVTIDDIAAQAHMSKGTVYNYIRSKEDFALLIQQYTLDDYKNKFEKILDRTSEITWKEILKEYIKAYMETVDRMQDAYNFLNHVVIRLNHKDRKVLLAGLAQRYDDFEVIIANGKQAGEFLVDDPKLWAHNIVRLITAWAHNRWHLHKFYSYDEFLEKQTVIILSALGIK